MLGVGGAAAQETIGPGFVEVTYMPAGAAFFTSKGAAPSFGNYGFGTAATFNINRYIGVEAELGSMIATTSDLQFGDLDSNRKAPNMLSYTGNAVVSLWTGHAVVPYATGGVGGLTMFERPGVGVFNDETFPEGGTACRRTSTAAHTPRGRRRRRRYPETCVGRSKPCLDRKA